VSQISKEFVLAMVDTLLILTGVDDLVLAVNKLVLAVDVELELTTVELCVLAFDELLSWSVFKLSPTNIKSSSSNSSPSRVKG
jgi:hypothetical protein